MIPLGEEGIVRVPCNSAEFASTSTDSCVPESFMTDYTFYKKVNLFEYKLCAQKKCRAHVSSSFEKSIGFVGFENLFLLVDITVIVLFLASAIYVARKIR
jgi:hypothetical protein